MDVKARGTRALGVSAWSLLVTLQSQAAAGLGRALLCLSPALLQQG